MPPLLLMFKNKSSWFEALFSLSADVQRHSVQTLLDFLPLSISCLTAHECLHCDISWTGPLWINEDRVWAEVYTHLTACWHFKPFGVWPIIPTYIHCPIWQRLFHEKMATDWTHCTWKQVNVLWMTSHSLGPVLSLFCRNPHTVLESKLLFLWRTRFLKRLR